MTLGLCVPGRWRTGSLCPLCVWSLGCGSCEPSYWLALQCYHGMDSFAEPLDARVAANTFGSYGLLREE